MSSTSGTRRRRASGALREWRVAAVALVGILWGQGALALGALVLPTYLAYGDAVRTGVAYRVVAYSALLPWKLAELVGTRIADGVRIGAIRAEPDTAFVIAVMAPLAACAIGFGIALACRSGFGRRLAAVIGVVVVFAGLVVAIQLADAARAEREFFALVSKSAAPHPSKPVVEGAQRFLAAHRYSRWRSEALRIEAMAAEESGDDVSAERIWKRFAESFGDPHVPGVAYAEYSRALCWERLGWSDQAAQHYRGAVAIVRMRGDGIQGWIGSDGATAVARIERADGRLLRAAGWTEKADDVSAAGRD